jgi:hypothetical protein
MDALAVGGEAALESAFPGAPAGDDEADGEPAGGGGGVVPTPNSAGDWLGDDGSAMGAAWAACWALVRSAIRDAVRLSSAFLSGAGGRPGTVFRSG